MCFNQPVNYLPNSIIHLTFGYHFDYQVLKLPKSIEKIILCEKKQISLFPKKYNNIIKLGIFY